MKWLLAMAIGSVSILVGLMVPVRPSQTTQALQQAYLQALPRLSAIGYLSGETQSSYHIDVVNLRTTSISIQTTTGWQSVRGLSEDNWDQVVRVEVPKTNALTFSLTSPDFNGEQQAPIYEWPWKVPITDLVRQAPDLSQWPMLKVVGPTIYWQPGVWIIDRDMIIPAGYTVKIPAGITLDLQRKARVLSYSPLLLQGRKSSPIRIHSSDKSGQGILLHHPGKTSKWQHVHIKNLSAPRRGQWQLPGAITVYESAIEWDNIILTSNVYGDDYVNFVRSIFTAKNVTFNQVLADALDSDFSRGTLSHVVFTQIGNDGLDTSGSQVVVDQATFDRIGDKAISVGEASQVTANHVTIHHAQIALTAKDASRLVLTAAQIAESQLGAALFQKKAEYSQAVIVAEAVRVRDVDVLYLMEPGSRYEFNGQAQSPTHDDVKSKLYGNEFGKSSR